MLDDDERVAEIAEMLQRRQEAIIVALMESYARLVEDVEHAHESRADLRRQPYALRLAARERPCRTRERQIVKPDVQEEAETRVDLLQDLRGDLLLALRERKLGEEFIAFSNRQRRDLGDVLAADLDGKHLGTKTCAMARRARRDRHVVLIVLAHRVRIRLTVAPRKHRHDALEGRMVQLVLAEHVLVAELELLLARAIEKKLLHLLVQVTKRRVDRIAVMLENGLHLAVRVCVEVLGKRREDSLGKRQRIVGHDEFQVKLHVAAEAAARRACAVRAVEREHARRDLGQADAAVDAREVLAEHQKLAVDDLHVDDALAHLQSRLQGIGEPLLHAFSHDEAVDDDLDRMLLRLVKADLFTKVDDLAVDAHAHIALAANAVENPLVLALLAAHDLRHDEELRALGQGLKLVHHLIDRLLRNGLAALRTMRAAGAREHQAHVVVDLRHRADRRARVVARRLLID